MFLKIILPVILVIGICGNGLNLYIFTCTRLKGLTTFRILAYLSFVDIFFIGIGIPHIITIIYQNYDFRSSSDIICSAHSFLIIYLSHLSSNIQAAVGVIRCVNVSSSKVNQGFNKSQKKSSQNLKSFRQRFCPQFGCADLLVLIISAILFFIDCHFLIWMRLSLTKDFSSNDESLNTTYVCNPSPIKQPNYFKFNQDYWVYPYFFLIVTIFFYSCKT